MTKLNVESDEATCTFIERKAAFHIGGTICPTQTTIVLGGAPRVLLRRCKRITCQPNHTNPRTYWVPVATKGEKGRESQWLRPAQLLLRTPNIIAYCCAHSESRMSSALLMVNAPPSS
eukprot:scaffold99578_cov28-Prasinocladus_malaysianus.AAC.1